MTRKCFILPKLDLLENKRARLLTTFIYMKRIILIIVSIVWIAWLTILTIALTDLVPNNPFKEYRFIIGMGFLTISGFIRQAYRKQLKSK
jgi:hypothetical protein